MPKLKTIRLATRRSPLALCQAELAAAWVREFLTDHEATLLPMSTTGDERQQWSLENKGGKGLFTRELEHALLEGEAELAVHSAKDLPTTLPEGLCIAGYLPRANPGDVWVHSCPADACKILATSSPRRRAQLQFRFPQVEWTTLRGNVGTRLRKLGEGAADGTVLAAAGLERLGIQASAYPALTFSPIPLEEMVPAPGQGAIALECRTHERERFAPLLCQKTHYAVTLEKRLLQRLGGGCQTPVGAHYVDGQLHLFHPQCGRQSIAIASGLDAHALDRILSDAMHQYNLPIADRL